MNGSNIVVVVSPVLAYQYKESNHLDTKPKGFEFQRFTSRKMVQKLETMGDPITLEQYADLLMTSIGFKLRGCFNAILIQNTISEPEQQILNALKFDTFVTVKGSYNR